VLLAANNVRVEFGKLVAVRDVSFRMAPGDLLGLIGPNGAGKTTLLRVLAGLQAPTSGTAQVMGFDVFNESERVRGQVAFSPDSPPAYEDLTVEQFLYFVADLYNVTEGEADERIDHWLEQVWLTERRTSKIRSLSRGMRQRVTIAQTLVPNPTVVLLDEPSSGLDPAGRIQLRQVIASLARQGKAVIVSSHILADLEEYCTHIAIIEHGKLLRYADVGELHETAALQCAYRVRLVGTDDATEALMAAKGVSHVVISNGAYLLQYEAGDEAAARLLKAFAGRGLDICSFAPVRQSLEEVYLKTGVKQVD
jgi:ABC-2 type transport system ATP-binding protein